MTANRLLLCWLTAAALVSGQGGAIQEELQLNAPETVAATEQKEEATSEPEEGEEGEQRAAANWNYADQQGWSTEYPMCRGISLRQSPVDIVTDRVIFKPCLRLEFIDYHQEVELEFQNTHHSVSLTPVCSSLAKPSLKLNWIGGREEIYELQEIHFHWGDGINKGSEHEINDRKAAAEMHMVHYRRGLDKEQIGSVENSVVVIGVLIESDAVEHNKLESLVRRTERVNGTDEGYKDDNPENLINLLPENHHSFYTYNGSLTTPPCYEVVTWVLMSEPVYMSQERLVELSNLEMQKPGRGRAKISSNYRDIQPLLDRPIYASFNASDTSTYKLSSHFPMKRVDEQPSEQRPRSPGPLRLTFSRAYGALDGAGRLLLQGLGLSF